MPIVDEIATKCKEAGCYVDVYRDTTISRQWEIKAGEENFELALSLDCTRVFNDDCISFFIRRSTVEINDELRKEIYININDVCSMESLGFDLKTIGRHYLKFWQAIGSNTVEEVSKRFTEMIKEIDGRMDDIRNVLDSIVLS